MAEERQGLPKPHDGMTPKEKGELLLRYVAAREPLLGLSFAEADLSDLDLRRAALVQADLHGARLDRTDLRQAMLVSCNMQHCVLHDTNLEGANLASSNLAGAVVVTANLRGANLPGANLDGAMLFGLELHNTGLAQASLDGIQFKGTTANAGTYSKSRWTPRHLADLVARGLMVVGLEQFPEDAARAVLGVKDGLTLYFNTRLHRLDRFLIEGVVVGILGRSTDVDVAEYRREEENTIVRLTGSDPADLEAVANALWHRVWEEGFQQRTQLIENRGDVGTQINVAGDYLAPRELPELVARLEALQKVGGDLTALRDVLERIELRLGQGEAEVRREWVEGD